MDQPGSSNNARRRMLLPLQRSFSVESGKESGDNLDRQQGVFHRSLSQAVFFNGGLNEGDELRGLDAAHSSRLIPRNPNDNCSLICANFYKLAKSESASSIEAAQDLVWDKEIGTSGDTDVEDLVDSCRRRQTCANQCQRVTGLGVKKSALKNSMELFNDPNGRRYRSSAGQVSNPIIDNENNPQLNGLGWQSTKPTLKDRMAFMLLNDHLADVMFTFPEPYRKRIPAHKFVLSIGSVVFDTMFKFNEMIWEGNKEAIQEIQLVDIEPKAFVALLSFLYTDEVIMSADSVMATLYTAKKYAVPALELICVNFLKENLSTDNAFMLLSQARLFDEPTLTELCLEIIDRETSGCVQADGFLETDLPTLLSVLRRDTLRINELVLFNAVAKWSIEQCQRRGLEVIPENQRNVLGGALNLIRFAEMGVEKFAEKVALSKLLTDRELVDIFLHFTLKPAPPIQFPMTPRRFIGKEMSVNRFQRIEASWGYNGTPDRIKFTVDAPIWILGFGLYGSMHDPSKYSVIMEIINFGSGQIVAHNETSFTSDGTPSIFRVMFKEPVEIAAGLTYIASAKLTGAESHYGCKGLRRIVRQISTGTNVSSNGSTTCEGQSPSSVNLTAAAAPETITFQFSFAAGNNNGTSVDDGQIPEIIFSTWNVVKRN